MRITNLPIFGHPGFPSRLANRGAIARAGFTLIESLIASVILAISTLSLATLLLSVGAQTEAMDDGYDASDAARQLMEEIVSHPLVKTSGTDKPGWHQGANSKASYDTVSDFHGFNDVWPTTITFVDTRDVNAGSGAITPAAGGAAGAEEEDGGMQGGPVIVVEPEPATISARESKQCRREVSVVYRNPATGVVAASGDVAFVTVNVAAVDGRGAPVTLTRVVTSVPITR